MDKNVIALLACPFCGSKIHLDQVLQTFSRGKIRFGVVSCSCDVFPIAEGILYLKKDVHFSLKHREAVALLKKKYYSQAVSRLFEERRRAKVPYALLVKGYLNRLSFRHFVNILRLFLPENRDWLNYLSFRTQRPTFFLALANVAYLQNSQVILDVGCSVGWFLQYAQARFSGRIFIGLETSFSALYLARKYILRKNVSLICADADYGLPFQPDSVDRIFINDVFMYLRRKQYFLQEALRIGKKNSQVFLSHIHSSLRKNMGQGYGLTAKELKTYIRRYALWGTADKKLFSSLKHQPHSYQRLSPKTKILQHPSCSLVMSKGKKFTPDRSPDWVIRLLQRTQLDFTEDPF